MVWIVFFCPWLLACTEPYGKHFAEWKAYFDSVQAKGCIVVYDWQSHQFFDYNPDRCTQRFPPNATLCLPLSVMALHVLEGEVPADSVRQAFTQYRTPFFLEVMQRIGLQKVRYYLRQFQYGNMRVDSLSASLWNHGLTISADEQIAFLRNFRTGRLGVAPHHMSQIVDWMHRSEHQGKKLFAISHRPPPNQTGWFIGWVEHNEQAWFFATNYERLPEAVVDTADVGRYITMLVLQQLKLWP